MGVLKRWLGVLLLLLVLVFGVFFSLQNTGRVPLDLLLIQFPEQQVSLWVLLAFAVGGVVGLIISGATLLRLKAQIIHLRRQRDKLTRELDQLRGSESRGVTAVRANGGLPKGP